MNQDFIITKINRVILVGKKEYPEKRTDFSQTLKSNELILSLSDESCIKFNGKTLKNEKDTVRFLPKGEAKEYIVERKKPGEHIVVYFDTDVPVAEEAFVLKLKNNLLLTNLFKKIFSVWVAKNDGYYFECISLLYSIFAELQKKNYIPDSKWNLISPAIEFINENFLGSNISVCYLAEHCHISESYLKKLFIKKYGVTPKKYIVGLKINYACDLLRSEMYSVTQVSEICRYNNIYFFSRQFKNYMGITPTTFIKKYLSSK